MLPEPRPTTLTGDDPTHAEAPPRSRGAALVPAVPVVVELLAAAERVLTTCAEVERERGDRALGVSAALDPALSPPLAVLGPDLPHPLADRQALRALRRLALALHPTVPGDGGGWWAPGGDRLVEFRAVVVDTRDLPLLAEAAAQLAHPRRAHEGALGRVRERLAGEDGEDTADGEPRADRHPDALGCLLATVLPVDDPDTVAVHALARETRAASARLTGVVLDARGRAAHRAIGARILRHL